MKVTDPCRRSVRGITLILVSGLLALGAILTLFFGQIARSASATAGSVRQARLADLAAESGLQYAGARLWQDPRSIMDQDTPPTSSNAADDWTCRGSEPLTRSPGRLDNPSYNHGEHWKDSPGGISGAYDAGTDDLSGAIWTDTDGNERFSSWTGRLRGGAAQSLFSMRIRSSEALLCVNSGEIGSPLDDHDLDGILNLTDTDYAVQIPPNAHRDPDYVGNLHLANLLDNLGAILGLSGPHGLHTEFLAPNAEPPDLIDDLGTIETSFLGRRVIEHRPKGGYASQDAVRQALSSFYTRTEIETVLPYLTTRGEVVPIPFRPSPLDFNSQSIWQTILDNPEARFEFHARIDFNTAPVAVIESALRHLSQSGPNSTTGGGMADYFAHLQAAEAQALAPILADARPIRTWSRFLSVLAGQTDGVWKTHVTSLFDQRLSKQSMILTQFDANRVMPELFLWRRNCLEVSREEPPVGIDDTCVKYTWKAALAGPQSLYFPPDSQSPELITGIPSRMTTEMNLSSSSERSDFMVDAEGFLQEGARAARTLSGEFRSGRKSLLVTGQQEFEPILGAGPNPARMTWPGGEAYLDAAERPATRIRTQTRPHFPVARFDGSVSTVNYPPAALANPAQYRYPRGLGWVGLSARQWRPENLVEGIGTLSESDITLSLPFNEDPGVDSVNNASWQDNLWDPYAAGRILLPPATLDLTNACVEEGINLSPDGPQNHTGIYRARWDCGGNFGDGFFKADANGPTAGTIVFWTSVGNGHDQSDIPPAGIAGLDLLYGDSARYLGLGVSWNAEWIQVYPEGGSASILVKPSTLHPADEIKGTGWRCIAVTVQRVGSDTHLVVYVDGSQCQPGPIVKDEVAPADAIMQFRLQAGGNRLQDVSFFKKVLTPKEIIGIAVKPLYEETGRYVSPRIVFDPDRLPQGAVLTGFSWDGFVPKSTRGTMTLKLSGYDAGGAKLADSPMVTWDGGESSHLACFFPPIAGCRKADFTVEFAVDPDPMDLHDYFDNVIASRVRILRETPILDEFRIFYTAGRPRWTSLR